MFLKPLHALLGNCIASFMEPVSLFRFSGVKLVFLFSRFSLFAKVIFEYI